MRLFRNLALFKVSAGACVGILVALGYSSVGHAQDLISDQIANGDTRVYASAGIGNTQNFTYSEPSWAFETESQRNFSAGLERDIAFGFGIGVRGAMSTHKFDLITDNSSSATAQAVTDGQLSSQSLLAQLHYRLENDIIEPHISFGLGMINLETEGEWGGAAYSNSETGITYGFGAGIDYVTQAGFTVGIGYNLELHNLQEVTNGVSNHTGGLRLGFEF